MVESAKPRGARKKPLKELKTASILVWMTPTSKELIEEIAKSQGDAPGTWMRKVGEAAALAAKGSAR